MMFGHFIDLILHWNGGEIWPLSMIMKNAEHEYNQVEDIGLIQFGGEGGLMGQIHYTTATHGKTFDNTITILAENATVRISGLNLNIVEVDEEKYVYDYNRENFVEVFKNIVKDMNGEANEAVLHNVGMNAVVFIADAYAMADRFY